MAKVLMNFRFPIAFAEKLRGEVTEENSMTKILEESFALFIERKELMKSLSLQQEKPSLQLNTRSTSIWVKNSDTSSTNRNTKTLNKKQGVKQYDM